MNVGRPSIRSCPSGCTRESMLERSPINVMSVGIILAVPQPLDDIREFITEKPSDYNKYRKGKENF
jgi:hypothetical protein